MEGLTIGIFDSGIGGLTVAEAIHRKVPAARLIYFGDTARCPYGDRSPDEVRAFARQVAAVLCARGVDLLVVACNTATAVALPDLRARCSVPVVGVVEPGARAAVSSGGRRIGVIGTVVTIASGAYEQALHRLAPDTVVISRACPAFVPLVEAGRLDGPEVEAVVRESLAPLQQAAVDTLILGCTHYPFLQPVIERVLGSTVRVISSAEETAREVARIFVHAVPSEPSRMRWDHSPGPHVFLTSGAAAPMEHAVRCWMGLADGAYQVETVRWPVTVPLR